MPVAANNVNGIRASFPLQPLVLDRSSAERPSGTLVGPGALESGLLSQTPRAWLKGWGRGQAPSMHGDLDVGRLVLPTPPSFGWHVCRAPPGLCKGSTWTGAPVQTPNERQAGRLGRPLKGSGTMSANWPKADIPHGLTSLAAIIAPPNRLRARFVLAMVGLNGSFPSNDEIGGYASGSTITSDDGRLPPPRRPSANASRRKSAGFLHG
jgi:hypothetical protein